MGQLLGGGEGQPAVAHELRVTAALEVGRGQPTGESLEEGVRARIVAARRDIDVVRAQKLAEALGAQRADRPDPLEGQRAPAAKVSSNRLQSRCRSSQASVSAPLFGLSDQLAAISLTFRPGAARAPPAGKKMRASTALGITTGFRRSRPSSS